MVSQFTLYAETSKGRRPTWQAAARDRLRSPSSMAFDDALRELGGHVCTVF